MKSIFKAHTLAGALGVLVVSASLLPASIEAAPVSPTGTTWDCLVNGSEGPGLAQLTFNEDFTFDGQLLIAGKPGVKSSSVNPRGGNGGGNRGDSESSETTTTNAAVKFLYGYTTFSGQWNYDAKGKVIGFFRILIGSGAGTNAATTTNMIGFKAIVTAKRLTLVASVPNGGKSTYSGLHMQALPDLSGAWYGNQIGTGQTLVEFFNVSSLFDGVYGVEGTGAAYEIGGRAMISARKRIGFSVRISDGNELRATVGTYNPKRRTAVTTGTKGEAATKIRFNAYHYPATD